MLLPKDRVGYLDDAPKHRAKAPKHPLKGAGKDALRAFHYKAVIRKRFLAHSGLLVPTSVYDAKLVTIEVNLILLDSKLRIIFSDNVLIYILDI